MTSESPETWFWHRMPDMSGTLVHEVLRLRQEVFILEQRCFYPDIDALDLSAHHLLGRDKRGALAAYCRVLEPGLVYAEPTVGRVLVAASARGGGRARRLMQEAHRFIESTFVTPVVRLNAQDYLRGFYESLGYRHVRGPYDEDGIAHVEMVREG